MNVDDTLNLISTIIQTESQLGTSQGSGFDYSRLGPKDGEGPQWREVRDMWLVTNRHVLILKNGETEEVQPSRVTFRLRRLDDSSAMVWEPVHFNTDDLTALAKFHPDSSVDVAVFDISQALKSRITDGGQYLTPYMLSADNFAGKNNIEVKASRSMSE